MYPRALRPFSLEGLPRLPRPAVRSSRLLARARARLPRELVVPVGSLGTITVSAARVAFVVPPDEGGVTFALDVRGERARLTVDPLLALQVVSAVLGIPAPVAVRSLGRTERGVLAAAIAGVLAAAGVQSLRLIVDEGAAGPLAAPAAVAVALAVQLPAGGGQVRLDLPVHLLATPAGAPLTLDARLLAPTLTVEAARTTLAGAALATAEPGDTLVFDGVPPLAEGPWLVRVDLGGCSFPAHLQPDGILQRRGPLRNESETRMSSEDANITAPVPSLPLSDDASRALAAAPVEIVAELGRLTMRGDELAGLVDGAVLALGPRRPAQVQLRVGGRLWAHGELVAIDDELGVRITELVK